MIEFITYKGEKYPIRFSHYALIMTEKETGKKTEDVQSDLKLQEILLWYSLEAGHHFVDKPLILKREDITWILDECYLDFQKALLLAGKAVIDMQKEVLEQDKKK
jgi:hypothetical protein